MASLRNVVKRREHRERAQPAERRHLGLLEKKKDYKQRANDFHRKEKELKRLARLAALRNPDEFYFKMKSSKTEDGIHKVPQKGKVHTTAELRRLKMQDYAHINMMRAVEANRVDALQSELHLLDKPKPMNKHTIFVDDEKDAREFDPARHFGTPAELVDQQSNRLRASELDKVGEVAANLTPTQVEALAAEQAKRYARLEKEASRKRKLDELLSSVQQQRNLMGKGKRVKLVKRDRFGDVDESKTVYKWRKERKG